MVSNNINKIEEDEIIIETIKRKKENKLSKPKITKFELDEIMTQEEEDDEDEND